MTIYPYLNFGGNCRAAFQFYEQHLGGKITAMMTHAELPSGKAASPDWGSAILHARMTIAGIELLASDVPDFKPVRSSYLSLTVESPSEAERIFALLTPGGEVFMPMQETFWALRFGILRDPFGVLWMVSSDRPASA
jgi:PhnB protein